MKDRRIILTGAGGGIGRHLARLLVEDGARVTLVDINEQVLDELRHELGTDTVRTIAADITSSDDRARIVAETLRHSGGVDMLVNLAGINPFGAFEQLSPEVLQRTIEINTLAPMLLTQAVLPGMLAQRSGRIVNIGSTFGSIGFAWFSAYSASKYALRGFSQALRRELAGTGVHVTYVAPRAVRTGINSQQVYDMAKVVKMNIDEPDVVAGKILRAIRRGDKECYIGFPESLFARINALLPGLVDRALRRQNRLAREFAAGQAGLQQAGTLHANTPGGR